MEPAVSGAGGGDTEKGVLGAGFNETAGAHAGQERYEVRGTLGALEQRLDPAQWLRVNRSQIINIESIAQLEPWFHGEYRVLLKDGTRTTWSRRYLGRAEEILGKGF